MKLQDEEKFYEQITAIDEKIKVQKRTPLHPYFTSQPYSLIQKYIKHFCGPTGKVLDLFGGSGTTLREALLLGHEGVHVDLLPWSCFIAKVSVYKPSDIAELDEAFEKLTKSAKSEINALYKLSKKDADLLPDPKGFPSKVKLPKNSDVETLGDLFTPRNKTAIWILLQTIKKEKNQKLRDFFLFVYSGILARASRTYWKDKEGKGGGDSGIYKVYRYWVPPKPDERNVWELFESRVSRVAKLIRSDNKFLSVKPIEPEIVCDSATKVSKTIGKESIDYIFTDPPYAKHITYLDLSTMYHALLGFEVTEDMRQDEAIEGGDNAKSLDQYIDLIRGSFQTAYDVLKFNRWMTVVFTHKDPNVFTRLIEAAVEVGFEYANAVPQDTKRPSFHKVNNSLTVLKGQMMLNFVKRRNSKANIRKRFDAQAQALVVRSAQNTIIRNNGNASFSDIVHDLYEKLLAQGYLRDMTNDWKDLEKILDEKFKRRVDNDGLAYEIKNNADIDELIPVDERLRHMILDYFHSCEKKNELPTFDDIWANVMPFMKGKQVQPTQSALLRILKEVANPVDEKHWMRATDIGQYQMSVDHQRASSAATLPALTVFKKDELHEHDTFIYLLAKIGINAGFKVHVGKKEQGSGKVNNESLKSLSLDKVPQIEKQDSFNKSLIEQVDLIWLDSEGAAIACFEIENTTKVEKTFDRFHALIGLYPQVKQEGRCFVVAHEDNVGRLEDKLTQSHWVGYPYFMERAVSFFTFDDFIKFYRTLDLSKKIEAEPILQRLQSAATQLIWEAENAQKSKAKFRLVK